jgi:hypothetical protein
MLLHIHSPTCRRQNLPRRAIVVEARKAEVATEQLVIGVGADEL